jgi:hypothetical protein
MPAQDCAGSTWDFVRSGWGAGDWVLWSWPGFCGCLLVLRAVAGMSVGVGWKTATVALVLWVVTLTVWATVAAGVIDLPRAFRTAYLWLIYAVSCFSRYSS